MCSIVNTRRGKIIFTVLIYSTFLIFGSNAKKSQTQTQISDKIDDEEMGGINSPISHEDKSQSQSQSVYSQMYPNYHSSSSLSSSANNYYPQYANWQDSLYYSKYPQRSIDSPNYYTTRQGKYTPVIDYPDPIPAPSMNQPDYVSIESPVDMIYMASSHAGGHGGGGGGHGGGHGHGHGHGHGWGGGGHVKTVTNYKVSAVNTDAIGLLGLLGLLSIFQAVLLSLTTTTAAGRRKRDVNGVEIDPETEMINHVSKLVLPSFNVIASAHAQKIPMNCTHHEVCRANNILVNDIGGSGYGAGERITEAISFMLEKVGGAKLSKEIMLAGEFGRNVMNQCQDVYPICKELEKRWRLFVAFIVKEKSSIVLQSY